MQVFYRPELSILRVRFWAEQLARCVFSQPLADRLDLSGRQFGPVSSDPLVYQPCNPVRAIRTTPLHQTGTTAARDGFDFLDRIALAVQSYRLVTRPRRSVFAAYVRSD